MTRSIAADIFRSDFLESDGGAAMGFDEVGELAGEGAGGVGGGGDGIAEEDGEGFIADVVAGVEDGIAKAAHFGLPDVVDAGEIVEGSEGIEFLEAAFEFEFGFEFRGGMEVFFEGALGAADDDEDVLDS